MSSERFFRELAYPFTDLSVLLAIVAFTLLLTLADAAGWLGLWLVVILAPALFRYLLMLLDAKAHGRTAPVAGIELFSPFDNFWTLVPLVFLAVVIWGVILINREVSPFTAQAFGLAVFFFIPASLAVLAITQSPAQSLNPLSIMQMIRVCGWQYVMVPAVVAAAWLLGSIMAVAGLPELLVRMIGLYCLVLMFTFMGALLQARGVRFALSAPGTEETEVPDAPDETVRARERVLNHAYGFFSRDNRAGALAHVRAALEDDPDTHTAYHWYFAEMLKWESKDAALLLAQSYLTRLLEEGREVEAVKLISRCLLENPAFRPLDGDVDAAMEAATRLKRDDLARVLQP